MCDPSVSFPCKSSQLTHLSTLSISFAEANPGKIELSASQFLEPGTWICLEINISCWLIRCKWCITNFKWTLVLPGNYTTFLRSTYLPTLLGKHFMPSLLPSSLYLGFLSYRENGSNSVRNSTFSHPHLPNTCISTHISYYYKFSCYLRPAPTPPFMYRFYPSYLFKVIVPDIPPPYSIRSFFSLY